MKQASCNDILLVIVRVVDFDDPRKVSCARIGDVLDCTYLVKHSDNMMLREEHLDGVL